MKDSQTERQTKEGKRERGEKGKTAREKTYMIKDFPHQEDRNKNRNPLRQLTMYNQQNPI